DGRGERASFVARRGDGVNGWILLGAPFQARSLHHYTQRGKYIARRTSSPQQSAFASGIPKPAPSTPFRRAMCSASSWKIDPPCHPLGRFDCPGVESVRKLVTARSAAVPEVPIRYLAFCSRLASKICFDWNANTQ